MNGPGGETDGLGNLDFSEPPFVFQLFLLMMAAVVIIPTVRMMVLMVADTVSMLILSMMLSIGA